VILVLVRSVHAEILVLVLFLCNLQRYIIVYIACVHG
jgi:hypothetical protein